VGRLLRSVGRPCSALCALHVRGSSRRRGGLSQRAAVGGLRGAADRGDAPEAIPGQRQEADPRCRWPRSRKPRHRRAHRAARRRRRQGHVYAHGQPRQSAFRFPPRACALCLLRRRRLAFAFAFAPVL
jgi:hypothetical protein